MPRAADAAACPAVMMAAWMLSSRLPESREPAPIRSSCLPRGGLPVSSVRWCVVAMRMKVTLPTDVAVDAEIDLCNSGDVYFLQAPLNVSAPALERRVGQSIVDTTHSET